MPISFILTSYNILPYIERCIQSVAEIAESGDEIILVDDGSDDGTVELIQNCLAGYAFAENVTLRPIYLGTNTIGGVGIAGNIGLNEARNETVFFVDGDDWIDAVGFRKARAHWTVHSFDILFTNYLEFDEISSVERMPSDAHKWATLNANGSFEDLRLYALAFIAVPWRKFYRRSFLEGHNIRFPEGDFFFEDNPFHWAVCINADSIGFLDEVVCYHRINRPGQTMASTGNELTAFFVHFDTILNSLPVDDDAFRVAAARWLLSNMTWHMERLSPSAYYTYAITAAHALSLIPDTIWTGKLAALDKDKAIWPIANRLRSGDINGQIDCWQRQSLDRNLSHISERLEILEKQAQSLTEAIDGIGAAEVFDAIIYRRAAFRTGITHVNKENA